MLKHSPHAVKTWTHELRYGNHVQGKDYLEYTRQDGTVCRCVQGVALYVAEQCGVVLNRTAVANRVERGEAITVSRFGSLTGALPEGVVRFLGLPLTSQEAGGGAEGHTAVAQVDSLLTMLANRNDQGETFEQLADFIDEYFAAK